MNNAEQELLAELFFVGLQNGPFILVKSIKDRTWMFFEEDERKNLKTTPTGLAVIGAFKNPWVAFHFFKKIFPLFNYSYESTASFLTGLPASLLVDANRAFDKDPMSEIIEKLKAGLPLVDRGSGPIIIDKLADSQG